MKQSHPSELISFRWILGMLLDFALIVFLAYIILCPEQVGEHLAHWYERCLSSFLCTVVDSGLPLPFEK